MPTPATASSSSTRMPIDAALPSELLLDTLQLLPIKDLVRCMLVSRRFLELVCIVLRCRTFGMVKAGGGTVDVTVCPAHAVSEVGAENSGSYIDWPFHVV